MVCPYCNNNSLPNSAICNHCGVILEIARTTRKKEKSSVGGSRIKAWSICAAIGLVAGIVCWLAGNFLLSVRDRDLAPIIGIVAGVGGALIGLIWMEGAATIRVSQLKRQRHDVQSQIHKIEEAREKRIEELQKTDKEDEKKELDPETRLGIATVHLVDGQIDEGLQQMEQVSKTGIGGRLDFLNNLGVAFARRGQLQLSVDRFQQALREGPNALEPSINLLYSVMQTGDTPSMQKLLAEQNGALKKAAEHPGIANRVGLTFVFAGQPSDGEHMIENALKSGSRFQQADAHNDLGIAKAHEKQFRDAITEFLQALQLDPGHAPSLANIGVVYYGQKKYAEAAKQFESAIAIDPHNGYAHSNLGACLCQMGDINEGIRAFREARLHAVYLFEPNYNLGKVYVENRVLDQAERCLARANEINPYSWKALVAQGVLQFKLNQISRATAVYRAAFDVRPEEPIVLNGLALCASLDGDHTNAEEYFRRALKISARDVNLHVNNAWHYLLCSDVNSATHCLEDAIALNPKFAIACNNMGLCQMEMGAYDAAEQYFEQAIASDPTMGTIHYNLGCNHVAQKALERAILAWEKAKQLESGNADLFTNLGVGYYKKEQFEKAVIEFRRVLHLRQEKGEDYANLGLALARLKRHKEAIEQFEKGLQIDPRNPMLHSNLGLACYFANRIEDAMREWQLVTQISKQYALMRAKKQQSEYDDSTIDFVPLYIAERARFTDPKAPDFEVPFVPGYETARWELIIGDDEIRRLQSLKEERDIRDRLIRAVRL
jgi:tetratricopeptide (TPR) repeat protein